MISIFRGDPHHPYHLSIGVVLLKDHQTVYTHRYTSLQKEGEKRVLHNIYTLIRETLEPGESLEEAIARGIQEEMGAVGEILTYIGSRKTDFMRDDVRIEKTTLYFVVQCIGKPTFETDENTETTHTEIQEILIDSLIPIMQMQENTTKDANFNESEILQKVQFFLQNHYVSQSR